MFFLGIILSMLILARGVGQLYGGTNELLGGEHDLDWIMIKCSLACI